MLFVTTVQIIAESSNGICCHASVSKRSGDDRVMKGGEATIVLKQDELERVE